MDVAFRTTRLKKCYEEERERVREWGEKVARVYVRRIDTLYAAKSAQDLHALAALRFHALKGDRTGQHAIWLTEFMRLIVTFEDEAMKIVQVEEVSKHYGD